MHIPHSYEFRRNSTEVVEFLLNTETDLNKCLAPVPVYVRRGGVLLAVGCAEGMLRRRLYLQAGERSKDRALEDRAPSACGGTLKSVQEKTRQMNREGDRQHHRCWKRQRDTKWKSH